MFPISDAAVVNQKVGWLSRIMQAETRHALAPYGEQRRTFTPLRPNAGLVGRVPTPLSRPSTQQGHRTTEPVDVASQPLSARGAAPARLPALDLKSGDSCSPPTHGFGRPSPALDAGNRSSRSSCLQPLDSARFADAPPRDEQHEHDVLVEINCMRRNPSAYAAVVKNELCVGPPFIVIDDSDATARPLPQNITSLMNTVAATKAELESARVVLEQLGATEAKDIAALREQWAIEDAERAKKKRAPATSTKKASASEGGKERTTEELEADRDAEIAALIGRNQELRQNTQRRVSALSNSLHWAQRGVAVLDLLIAKLSTTPPLQELDINIGLCLAARDLADAETEGARGVDPVQYTARYGSGEGAAVQCITMGIKSPRDTVMDLLLSLPDPKREGRHALLNPAMRLVGCGWRRHPVHVAATAVITAVSYSEFTAIGERSHLPLHEIRRTLPFAKRISTAVRATLDVPRGEGFELVEPYAHPVKTHKKLFRAVLTCPDDSFIVAAVVQPRKGEAEMPRPSFIAGRTFAQRRGGADADVEVYASLPSDGEYKIVFYGNSLASSTPASASAVFMSTQKSLGSTLVSGISVGASTAAPSAATGARTFRRLGAITVIVANSDPLTPVPTLPVATVDFHERRCRVSNPTDGALRPDTEYRFVLEAPLTQYKADELQRVEMALANAIARTESSRHTTAALEEKLAVAVSAIAAAEADEASAAPVLMADIAALQRDAAKKKGKELEKLKAAVAELEERLAALNQRTRRAVAERDVVEEQLAAHRRGSRQASAQRQRYIADKQRLVALTDRSKPLSVEMSIDERRARFAPLTADGTSYVLTLRTPKSGRLTVFVSGVAVLTYDVYPEAADWPETDPSEW